MKQSDVVREIIRNAREKHAVLTDGSYIFIDNVRHPDVEQSAHSAYTPAQIDAERQAILAGKVVYCIRDESVEAPYWISPYRQAIRKIEMRRKDSEETLSVSVPHVLFTVARSRDSRKSESVEVAMSVATLQAKKPEERKAYILEQLRTAIASLLTPVAA